MLDDAYGTHIFVLTIKQENDTCTFQFYLSHDGLPTKHCSGVLFELMLLTENGCVVMHYSYLLQIEKIARDSLIKDNRKPIC